MAGEDAKQAEGKDKPVVDTAEPTKKAETKSEKKASKKAKDDEFNASNMIHVKLYSPFQVYYDDDAESVSAENSTGPFDILPRHHNFITLLRPCDVEIRSPKGSKTIKISRGVMHVRRNKVTIFLDV